MNRWSYRVEEWSIPESSLPEELEQKLEETGDQFWELVHIKMESVFYYEEGHFTRVVAVFKRNY